MSPPIMWCTCVPVPPADELGDFFMGAMHFETDCRLPAADRLAQWQQQLAIQPAPMEIQIDRSCGFTARLISRDVGVLSVKTFANKCSLLRWPARDLWGWYGDRGC